MHVHIAGICGTFMAGVARIAVELGYKVSGSDEQAYPPMSDQLASLGIEVIQGYSPSILALKPDLIIVGNVMKRGNPLIEEVLNRHIPYISGPAWLAQAVLRDRWVIGVSGTHGKTTTASMVAHLFDYAGFAPGFLIGGVPENFGVSSRLGRTDFFVIEADEYDTAFFDKRAKFVHYTPKTFIIGNLEFDHADIYDSLEAIKTQFHHCIRTIPGIGQIIVPGHTPSIESLLAKGCWTPVQTFGPEGEWKAVQASPEGSSFEVWHQNKFKGQVAWELLGSHNVMNALAAIAAGYHCGIDPQIACESLSSFKSVKRRMQPLRTSNGIVLYDDFAHHPTAITTTLAGLRQKIGAEKTLRVLVDIRSNTMRQGVHKETLGASVSEADRAYVFYDTNSAWDVKAAFSADKTQLFTSTDALYDVITKESKPGDVVVIMSNGSFGGLTQRLHAAWSLSEKVV